MSLLLLLRTGNYATAVQAGQSVNASATVPLIDILQTIIPSYLYQEYADDVDLQAFVDAYNSLAQSYLDWFNATPLAIYTSPQISGPLLDWTMQGIYGIERPVFSSRTTRYVAGLNSLPLNSIALNGHKYFQSGTATIATDDYYKRVGTWTTYIGDGKYFNVGVLRKKVARFIYGVNGTDITQDQVQTVHIEAGLLPLPVAPVLSSISGGSIATRQYGVRQTYISPIGESLAGAGASLTVAANYLLEANSPPAENGAVSYNLYVNVLSTNPAKFIAGLNSGALNGAPLNGTNKRAVSPPTKQNASPTPIGTNWTEPTSGLIVGAALPTVDESNTSTNLIITVPAGVPSQIFQQALEQGILAFPFQLQASVIIA